MLNRLKSFFATVDRGYHINVVKGLTDALERAEKDKRTAQDREKELTDTGNRLFNKEAETAKEVRRLRKALAESEATSEQRRIALEHEHTARKDSDENAKAHASRAKTSNGQCERLRAQVSTLEDDLSKSNRSLGISRDNNMALRKSLDDLREVTNDALNFLYRNSQVGSEAHEIGCMLAEQMNN